MPVFYASSGQGDANVLYKRKMMIIIITLFIALQSVRENPHSGYIYLNKAITA